MAGIADYRRWVKEIITDYGSFKPDEGIEFQLVFDETHDHYQLMVVGWRDLTRHYGCVLHFDLKGDKIWIQHNGTEDDIAAQLHDKGVSPENIVLGFQAPYKRHLTGYAAA